MNGLTHSSADDERRKTGATAGEQSGAMSSADSEWHAAAHSAFVRRAVLTLTPMGLLNGPEPLWERTLSRAALTKLLENLEALAAPKLLDQRPEPGSEAFFAVLGKALRWLRLMVILHLAERQARGLGASAEAGIVMTDFAEIACQRALMALSDNLADPYGRPTDENGVAQGLLVIGMGKLGGAELNVSSDIDLVFVYPEAGQTNGLRSISNAEYFDKLGRALIRLLDANTADGFVFRVDMRLRPHGDAGPMALSLDSLEEYLQSQGREWERFAWLKSRLLASSEPTNLAADQIALQAIVRPFVYRRYLDFSAIDSMRALHAMIRAQANRTAERRSSHAGQTMHVKLGVGGIREVEFSAQMLQMIRAGRDPVLREPNTLRALRALSEAGVMSAPDALSLSEAYTFQRDLEHALQFRDDAQTHWLDAQSLPDAAALMRIQPTDLLATLSAHAKQVARIFETILGKPSTDTNAATDSPVNSGHPNQQEDIQNRVHQPPASLPEKLSARLTALQLNRRYLLASEATRQIVGRLTHALVSDSELAQSDPNGDRRARLIDLLEMVLGRPSYLALIEHYPQLLGRVVRIMQSEWAAQYLIAHPIVLDELIDGQLFAEVDYEIWQQRMATQLEALVLVDGKPDRERQMDVLREEHHSQIMRLLAQDVEAQLTLEHLSDRLSELADRCLTLSVQCVWAQIAKPEWNEPVPSIAVIAYGRLGGKELGYASDLDLVFLYDGADSERQHRYIQLAQRLTSFMASQTSAGVLFEIDTRLRPNGNAGMLVSSISGFKEYQLDQAWTWEHQALTRARFCTGDPRIGTRFEAFRRRLLSGVALRLSTDLLREEVLSMRIKVSEGHPNRSALFDLKHDRGGMVDIEFAMQFLVLRYAGQFPQLLDNVGNIALLARAAELQLIEPELSALCAQAYRFYRQQQHRLRLDSVAYPRLAPDEVQAHRDAVVKLWAQTVASPT
jgi:[glutamine synthetase] adenylyltransferase / [glutamine synthetase]-adenylyl-L-tyrosine phosphorylase